MNPIVFHIVSGQAFFTGISLIITGAWGAYTFSGVRRRMSLLVGLFGLVAVAVSSTPIPYWYYAVASVVMIAWLIGLVRMRWQRELTFAMTLVWLGAIGLELPYHFTPKLNAADSRSLTVIGDSVTAGVDGNETSERWPIILTRAHDLPIQDLAHMGETCGSAWKRVQTYEIKSPIVLLEIGGNDLLSSMTCSHFARDLELLLSFLARPSRQLIMFELPLPPFYHEYGRIQRTLAARYEVHLIPKRVFLSVLAGQDSTLDSIHLSQVGHQRMADTVWQMVSPAFPEN